MKATGIWKIREYVRRRQAQITEYVVGRPIYKFLQAQSGFRVPVGSYGGGDKNTATNRQIGR